MPRASAGWQGRSGNPMSSRRTATRCRRGRSGRAALGHGHMPAPCRPEWRAPARGIARPLVRDRAVRRAGPGGAAERCLAASRRRTEGPPEYEEATNLVMPQPQMRGHRGVGQHHRPGAGAGDQRVRCAGRQMNTTADPSPADPADMTENGRISGHGFTMEPPDLVQHREPAIVDNRAGCGWL